MYRNLLPYFSWKSLQKLEDIKYAVFRDLASQIEKTIIMSLNKLSIIKLTFLHEQTNFWYLLKNNIEYIRKVTETMRSCK